MPEVSELLCERGFAAGFSERFRLYDALDRKADQRPITYTGTDAQNHRLIEALEADMGVPSITVDSRLLNIGDQVIATVSGRCVIESRLKTESINAAPSDDVLLGEAEPGFFPFRLLSDNGVREGTLSLLPDPEQPGKWVPLLIESAQKQSMGQIVVEKLEVKVDELGTAFTHFWETATFDAEHQDWKFATQARENLFTADFLFNHGVDLSLAAGSCSLSVFNPAALPLCVKAGSGLFLNVSGSYLLNYVKVMKSNIGSEGVKVTERDVELLIGTLKTMLAINGAVSLGNVIKKRDFMSACTNTDVLNAFATALGSTYTQDDITSPVGKVGYATMQIVLGQAKTVTTIICGKKGLVSLKP